MRDWRFVLLFGAVAGLAAALLAAAAGGAFWLGGRYAQALRPPRPATELTVRLATDEIPRQAFQALVDDVRRVVREGRLGFAAASGDSVEVTIRDGVDRQQALVRLHELAHQPGPKPGAETERFTITEAGGALLRLVPTTAAIDDRVAQARDQAIQVLGRRLDSLGLEPTFTRSGADLIVIVVPLQPDTARLKEVIVTPGKLEFRLVDTSMSPQDLLRGQAPPESEALHQKMGDQRVPILVKKQALVDGNDLTDAQASHDQRNNEPVVIFKFNSAGARKFGRATQENVGRPFAIVLDNEVISAPVIREPILGGSGQISGNFTVQSAIDLAILLRSGALPVPLTIIEERTIEP
jgi:preprotein translocase subunit SecD